MYCLVAVNGLTFLLLSSLLGFLAYLQTGSFPSSVPIEIMIYTGLMIILTALSFKPLAFWLRTLFVPSMHKHRLCKF